MLNTTGLCAGLEVPSVGVEFDGELVACLNDTPLSAQQSYEECAHLIFPIQHNVPALSLPGL